MSGSRNLWRWWKDGVDALAFGNPLYDMVLGGRTVPALAAVPLDPWPGSAANGSAILANQFRFAEQTLTLREPPNTEAFWQPNDASDAWYAGLHSFHWLRDLRALGGDEARRQARTLVLGWLCCHASWNGDSWAPAIVGARVANWIGLHDFFFASADEGFRFCVFDSLGRQTRHLRRVLPDHKRGAALITAIKGLAYGGLCLPQNQGCLTQVRRLLDQTLGVEILADGGHIERNPSIHLAVLRDLIDIRSVFRVARVEVPAKLINAIDRMTPALRFMRHGDGSLVLFNGGREEDPALIETVLAQADSRSRPLRTAPELRFERLHGGRALVVLDAGPPPPPGYNRRAHAGTLSFEFSVGRERLVTNCGSHPEFSNPWHTALAGTAAHSTVTIAETNSSGVVSQGGVEHPPGQVTCTRRETADEITIIASHNGYVPSFGLLHRRTLHLDQHGDTLHGEDSLEPAVAGSASPASASTAASAASSASSAPPPTAPRPFAIRFHLHPAVQAQIVDGIDGPTVILRSASGTAWRFTAEGGTIELAESIYRGTAGPPRPTLQIVVHGEVGLEGASVGWAFHREHATP